MALTVQTNMQALKAQRYTGLTQNRLTKSIESLSSGFRINSPADDASGLSIAEQIKGQIGGYERAYLNAQDGMSMLQVADGALVEVSSMLQRIRELSVQAANGVYSANDRSTIQMEIDELKDEINRVSNYTEFNTRKLLNGEGTGIWSADSADVDVVMKGRVVSGNYNIEVSTTPGQNAVYQTDVFKYQDNSTAVNITQGKEQGIVNQIHQLDLSENNPITGEKLVYNFDVEEGYNDKSDNDVFVMGSSSTENSLDKIDNKMRDVEANKSGYLLVEFNQAYPNPDPKTGDVVGDYVTMTWYDANGDGSQTVDVPATYDNNWNVLNTLGLGTAIGGESDDFDVDLSTLDAFDAGILDLEGLDDVAPGDRVLLAVSDRNTAKEQADTQGIEPEEMTVKLNPFHVSEDAKESEAFVEVQFNKLSGTRQTFQQIEMDENGKVWTYKYAVDFAGDLGNTVDSMSGNEAKVVFDLTEDNTHDTVTLDTRLSDIAQFTASDGQAAFGNGIISQDLLVYSGNGENATVHLTELDTVRDFDTKLTNALTSMGLGSSDPTINDNLVTFVDDGTKTIYDGNVIVPGSMVVQSPLTGQAGKLYFRGDERLVRGLSLSGIKKAEENVIRADIYDLYTGKLVGSEVTKDGVVKDVIPGADVLLNTNVGLNTRWDNSVGGIVYTPDTETVGLHMVDTRSFVQAGPNPEQTIKFTIPQVDTTALGIDDLFVVDVKSAEEALYKIDQAQYKLNELRGSIGAQMNRMEHTLNEIEVTNENMSAAESRIRDLDMAKEMTEFTMNQILAQTSTAMLAQANMMPQLVLQLLGA